MGISGRRRDGGVRGGGERRRRRRSGGKNRGGRKRSGERDGEPDGSGYRVASSGRVEEEPGRQGGRRWPGACWCAVATRLASFWREVEDDWLMGLVGCYSARPARWAAQ